MCFVIRRNRAKLKPMKAKKGKLDAPRKRKSKRKKEIEPILVDKGEFNSVLSRLLQAEPVPMASIKTSGKRSKGTLFPDRSES
jgi:hypothetical protein